MFGGSARRGGMRKIGVVASGRGGRDGMRVVLHGAKAVRIQIG